MRVLFNVKSQNAVEWNKKEQDSSCNLFLFFVVVEVAVFLVLNVDSNQRLINLNGYNQFGEFYPNFNK